MSQAKLILSLSSSVLFFYLSLASLSIRAADAPLLKQDPHYTEIGFFDIHICNWPERPHFFKILFSTEKFDEIAEMEVFDPAGSPLAILDKSRFLKLHRKDKPEKRVFIVDLDLPDSAKTGWYTIKVKTIDGRQYSASDFVPLTRLGRVTGMSPSSETEAISLPVTLRWKKLPGAGFYKVFVRDEWTGEIVYQSKLISNNEHEVPAGKLQPEGYYSWVVHARDLNEHILLGDFHMGSRSKKAYFSLTE